MVNVEVKNQNDGDFTRLHVFIFILPFSGDMALVQLITAVP